MASETYDRIKKYATDLDARITAREEWWERNPDYKGIVDDWLIPESLLQKDPLPNTRDILTSERFRDILFLITKLWEKTYD